MLTIVDSALLDLLDVVLELVAAEPEEVPVEVPVDVRVTPANLQLSWAVLSAA